jgi:ferredoxin/DMSO/TMAO reductase YedYZ heme-binding membrane subunit
VRNAQESVHLVAATVGFISLILLWLAVVWGLVLRNGWAQSRMKHATVYGIHQTVALLGLCLAAVHGFAQLATPGGTVELIDTLVPFTNDYDPVGIGAGVVALEVTVACAVSVLLQRRLGYTRWRALHALTYVGFMLIVAHVLISGSDLGSPIRSGAVLAAWLITVLLWISTTSWFHGLRRERAANGRSGRGGDEILVNVDGNRCAQFGFCQHEAPEVFALRSDGRLAYRAAVSADQADAVIRAVEVCPARAIALHRTPTTVLTQQRKEPPEEMTGPRLVPIGGSGAPRRRRSAR